MHRGRRPKVFASGTGQFLNSTCIRTNQSRDGIIMGDFNHGNIKWDTKESTGVEEQKLLCLIHDNFLTQHVLEPTRAARILDIVLSSQT